LYLTRLQTFGAFGAAISDKGAAAASSNESVVVHVDGGGDIRDKAASNCCFCCSCFIKSFEIKSILGDKRY
jgi:hypothetical protein